MLNPTETFPCLFKAFLCDALTPSVLLPLVQWSRPQRKAFHLIWSSDIPSLFPVVLTVMNVMAMRHKLHGNRFLATLSAYFEHSAFMSNTPPSWANSSLKEGPPLWFYCPCYRELFLTPVWAPPALGSKHRQEVHQQQPPLNKRSLPWCLAKECPRAHSTHLSGSLCCHWCHHRSPSPTAPSTPSYLLNSLPPNTISTWTLGYTVSPTQCSPEILSSCLICTAYTVGPGPAVYQILYFSALGS